MIRTFLDYYLFDYEIGVYPEYTDLSIQMIKEKMDHFSQVLFDLDKKHNIQAIIACFFDKKCDNEKWCVSFWRDDNATKSSGVTPFLENTKMKEFLKGKWLILNMPYYLFENRKITKLKREITENKIDLFSAYQKCKDFKSDFIWREAFETHNLTESKEKLKRFSKKYGHEKAYQKLYCALVFKKDTSIEEAIKKEFVNSFALTIKEWGLDILYDEIIKHGTRAAVAAIMSRNMSHNIGSHVLSYWKNDLDTGNKLLCEYISGMAESNKRKIIKELFDSKKVEKKESGNYIEKSYFLFDYLKNRMDFIAEITTTSPSWEKSINLYAIIQRFLEQKALLDNIILSEGFCYIGDSVSAIKECPKREQNGVQKSCEACKDKRDMELIPYKIKLLNGKNSFDKYDVSIPHGHIGEQAIYSIFENLIRNSAKHGGTKIKNRINSKKKDSIRTFEINIKAEDAGEFIALTVSDNVGNCNDKITDSRRKKKRIIEFLNEGLQETGNSGYVSSSGELIKEKWGIKEMKMSANFLRKRTIDSIIDKNQIDDDDREKSLIHLECYEANCGTNSACEKGNKNIAYTFYLRKPKEACIVYKDNELDNTIISRKDELQKRGILILTIDEAVDILQKKENIPHRFLVLSSADTWKKFKNNKSFNIQRLPLRIVVNDNVNKKSIIANNKPLLKEVYSSVDFNNLTSVDDFIKSIKGDYCAKFRVKNITTQMPKVKQKKTSIFIDDHGKSYEKNVNKIFYYHPYGITIGKTFYDYFDPYKDNIEPIKLELIEMANIKVVVADERIYNINQNKKVSDKINDKLQLLKECMKVSVLPVISGVVNKNAVLKDKNAGDYLIIHQGLIDKMENKKGFLNDIKSKYSFVVIDSGRGVPNNLEPDTRYIEIGAIERFIDELDKNSLIQTLFSLRRPKHV